MTSATRSLDVMDNESRAVIQQQRQQQLTFTDYEDLQSRLVLLPLDDEDDEGTGAVISMYYATTTTNPNYNSGCVDGSNNSGSDGDCDDDDDDDATTDPSNTTTNSVQLHLDNSVSGYVLVHISSSLNDEAATSPRTGGVEETVQRESCELIETDFASILSTIRNHPTPIVLTFANRPVAAVATASAATAAAATTTTASTDVTASVDVVVDHDENDEIATTVIGDLTATDSTAIISQSKADRDTATTTTTTSTDPTIEQVGVGVVPFEEEKKSEDGTTHCGTNQLMTDLNSPPPPPNTPYEQKEQFHPATTTTTVVSPSLFTTKNLSSWTSRMSAAAVTKATALAKAANEQAKVTSAFVAAAVVPEFPLTTTTSTSTTTTSNNNNEPSSSNDTTNTIYNYGTAGTTPPVVLHASCDSAAIEDNNDTPHSAVSATNDIHESSDHEVPPTPPATESATVTVVEKTTTTTHKRIRPCIQFPDLHIYVQSETGAFVPVPETSNPTTMEHQALLVSPTKANQSPLITNSSYVMVRVNVQQPAPTNNTEEEYQYRYQWYRSYSKNEWVKLAKATGPSLQPSATEIGYRLRCVVSAVVRDSDIASNTKDDEADDSNSQLLICETADIVTASLPILNGSRQALGRGAQFGGLLGLGKADGRTFRVKIVLSSSSSGTITDRRKTVLSDNGSSSHSSTMSPTSNHSTIAAVTIYQVAGTTAEPIHPESEPLFCRAATVWDYNQIKDIALIFLSHDIPPSASMVAALCSTENDGEVEVDNDHDSEHFDCDRQSNHRLYFRLQAPNRLARESMLLSIGIANFQGKPSQLNATSVLFPHHQIFNECYSGSASSSLGDDSIVSQSSSIAWQSSATPEKITVQRRTSSLGGGTTDDGMKSDLEEELEALRKKLTRKDKVISELQRQLTHSDELQRQTETKFLSIQKVSEESHQELLGLQKSLGAADVTIEKNNCEIQTIKEEYDSKISALEYDMQTNNDRIVSLERENRTLQNDKDVLNAAVESRDFKLTKMEELQTSLDEARVKLTQRNNIQLELTEVKKRYNDTLREVERLQMSNREYDNERNKSNERIVALEQVLHVEATKNSSHQSKLEMEQMKVQKLKAERNSYKQKGDSLAKEMSRICRDGRTIRDIEKILADDVTRREEVNLLRDQKRKALDEVEHFRTAYEQSLGIQQLAGLNHDAGKLLERNAELERILSELTEYLNAKEMQIETMKQVNDTLQSEIRDLAKASMSNNDI